MGSSSSFSSGARSQAAHILSQPPFTSKPAGHVPDPLAGVLRSIGHLLSDVARPFDWVGRHVSSLFHGTFGSLSWVVLIVLAIAAGATAAWLLIRRRPRLSRTDTTTIDAMEREDAASLEAAAATAETNGDLDAAVRLRFRAGLARLEAAGIIASRLVTTTQQVRRTLHSPTFDDLAERHESIVYAGRAASTADTTHAREGWPRVIDEVRTAATSSSEAA